MLSWGNKTLLEFLKKMHQAYALPLKFKVAVVEVVAVVKLCGLIYRDDIFIQLSSSAFQPLAQRDDAH